LGASPMVDLPDNVSVLHVITSPALFLPVM
jgi:hypothetical protein